MAEIPNNQDFLQEFPNLDYRYFNNAESARVNLKNLFGTFAKDPDTKTTKQNLVQLICESADPDQALVFLVRLFDCVDNKDELFSRLQSSDFNRKALITLFSGSKFLSDFLLSKPHLLNWLLSKETLLNARDSDYYNEGIERALENLTDINEIRRSLILWRKKELMRIALRDLMQLGDAEEVSRDISDLAQSLIAAAAQISYAALTLRYGIPMGESQFGEEDIRFQQGDPTSAQSQETGMCVLGMGKLGGRELNFASDIDLIFVYDAEGETTGRLDGTRRVAVISNHVFFTKMGESIVKFLGERGPDGTFYRVDMRLRPEGQDGPLARSLESFITYLNSQARDWERIAYLKARVMCGPKSLENKLYRIISGFVYSGVDARRIVDEVQQLKVRIDREVIHSDLYHREVKRGYGGIREIEFVVAAMQIIHGNSHNALRVRNTFLAIQRLREVHVLSLDDEKFYLSAYEFLRNVEHRLQMDQELQTHTIPLDGIEFEALAKRSGFQNGNDFQIFYETLTTDVHRRFVAFFERDLDALEQETKDIFLILDRSVSEDEALAALERRGLTGKQTLRLIQSLVYGNREVFVSAEGQRFVEQMLPALLRMASAAAFPEQVFPRFNSFVLSIKGITYYYEVIANHPDILKLLTTLFGSSEQLSSYIISRPEFFDALISTRVLNEKTPSKETRNERLRFALTVKSPARRQQMLRRAVNFERLLIGLQFLLKLQDLPTCLQALSCTADISLDLAVKIAAAKITERINEKQAENKVLQEAVESFINDRFQILAFGKYGGSELNFFGDLDVVFFYEESALPEQFIPFTSDQEFFNYLSDTIITIMSETIQDGKVFMVDARLRPHGKNAPIAVTADSYIDYIKSQADVWELQSFTRARPVWGNLTNKLGQLNIAFKTRLQELSPELICTEIRSMRSKLAEHAPTNCDFEIKRSDGGITDIEFLVQWWILSGKITFAQSNANYFHSLQQVSCIDEADKKILISHYRFLRTLENTMRIVNGNSDSTYIITSPSATGISRLMSYASPEELVSKVNEVMSQVKQLVEKHLILNI